MEKNNRISVLFLGILTVLAVGFVLKAAQSVILPLVIAWLLSYILGPVVSFMTQRRIPTALAVFLVLVLLVGVVYVAAQFLHARIAAFAGEYPKYQQRFTEIFGDINARWNLPQETLATIEWGDKIGGYVRTLAGSLVSFMSSLVMVMIFLIFLLLGKPFFKYKIRKAFTDPEVSEKITGILNSIAAQFGGYLAIQVVISLLTGFLVWLSLTILKVDFPVTWGALAFFLNFIPTIGSIMASIPPILLALVQFYPSFWPAVVTLIVLLSIQMLVGNVLAPKVMGDRLNLSPVVVLLSLVFWGWLWGITGALLSTPIASAIKIVCENIEPLKPVAVLMSSGKRYRAEFKEPLKEESA